MAARQVHFTQNGFKFPGFKSPIMCNATIHNNTVYMAGNIGMNPRNMKLADGNIGDRLKQAIDNMRVVLEEVGSGLEHILMMKIFITSMDDYDIMNEAYMNVMPEPRPPRTCVAVKEIPFGTDIEIECIAALGDARRSKL
uniref:Uncharacterized protein n=1 Tax=Photinus pyralis TaxID=7054 RepID=A0A1Y1KXU5_PHOPY